MNKKILGTIAWIAALGVGVLIGRLIPMMRAKPATPTAVANQSPAAATMPSAVAADSPAAEATAAPTRVASAANTGNSGNTGSTANTSANSSKRQRPPPVADGGGTSRPHSGKAPKGDKLASADTSNNTSPDEPPVLTDSGTPAKPSGPAVEMLFPAGTGTALAKISQLRDETGVRVEFSGGTVPKCQSFRMKNPSRILINCDGTDVPGPPPAKTASAPLREISAKTMNSPDGPVASIQILLVDDPADADKTTKSKKPAQSEDGGALTVHW